MKLSMKKISNISMIVIFIMVVFMQIFRFSSIDTIPDQVHLEQPIIFNISLISMAILMVAFFYAIPLILTIEIIVQLPRIKTIKIITFKPIKKTYHEMIKTIQIYFDSKQVIRC